MCNAFGHIAGFGMNFGGALWETINDNEAPFLAGPFNFFGRLAGKESKRIAQNFVDNNLEEIPDLISDIVSTSSIEDQVQLVRAQKQSNWSIWTNLGYLSDRDFPASHPNFTACFKPGEYVAKCQLSPTGGKEMWLFSRDTSLAGKPTVGTVEDYPHYTVVYQADGVSTADEHFTYANQKHIYFHNLKGAGNSNVSPKRWETAINAFDALAAKAALDNDEVYKYMIEPNTKPND